jgi:hypothetical protein
MVQGWVQHIFVEWLVDFEDFLLRIRYSWIFPKDYIFSFTKVFFFEKTLLRIRTFI